MMDRRKFLAGTGAILFAAPFTADAQPGRKRPTIVLLFNNTPLADMTGPQPASDEVKAFLDGMRALGWRDGENITIERRSAEGQPDRRAGLVQELVGLRVDLVVVSSVPTAKMIKQASDTMPVVMSGGGHCRPAGPGGTHCQSRSTRRDRDRAGEQHGAGD
jgi:putative ABC transport system substrate-binding protein